MYKIMIVDDEYYFRQYLKNCIDWQAQDCEIVGEASDGEEGLLLLKEINPDIVLLDINMPCIDGLEFSKKVFEERLETKIIILSGHSEFEYAQKAVKYRVNGYLLKPLKEEELCQALSEVCKELAVQRNRQKELRHMGKQARISRPLLEEKLLASLLRGVTVSEAQEYKLLRHKWYQILVVELEEYGKTVWDTKEEGLWMDAVKNIICEALPEEVSIIFHLQSQGQMACLVGGDTAMAEAALTIKDCVKRATRFIGKKLPFQIAVGMGKVVTVMEQIQESYQQALFCLKNRYMNKDKQVLEYDDARVLVGQNTCMNAEVRRKIMINLNQGEIIPQWELIDSVFEKARQQQISYDMLQCHCMEFIFVALEYLEEISVSFEKIFPEHPSPLFLLSDVRTIEEGKQEIKGLYEALMSYVKTRKSKGGLRQIEGIKEYIAKHYSESEFKILDISEAFFINYHYLCSGFKKQTGITLNQYITQYRIEKAKQLIEDGCQNITLLAEKVGYNDLSYFGKSFKKQIGISPSAYIERTK